MQLVVSWRQRYPALEAPIGNLQAVDRCPTQSLWYRARTTYDQASFIEDDFDLPEMDARQSHQQSQLVAVLVQIDRWFPAGHRLQALQGKKAALQSLSALQQIECLRPHP